MMAQTGIRVLVLLAMVALLSGCGTIKGWFSKKQPERPPDIMAEEGIKQLKKKKYDDAIETFEMVRDRYPYSEQALLAQLKVADAYFYKKKYDEALQSYKDFEKLHPTNKAVPYCVFRQAMCYFRQRSTIDRDQTYTQKAMEEFKRLKQKYPDCEYITKADKYLGVCHRDLGEHERYIADFYFRTKRYQAALERYQTVAQEYADLPDQNEVQERIAECQKILATDDTKPKGFLSKVGSIFDAKW